LLVFAMALVTLLVTGSSLLLIRHQLSAEVTENLTLDLAHSVTTFQEMQAERIGALDRENALLANLPTLKALMTSRDDLTIQDGAVEFWNISGTDLFALADSSGRIVADYTRGSATNQTMRSGLSSLLASPGKHYLIDGSLLYACSVRPLFFGGEENGTLLGYVISGASIERSVRQILWRARSMRPRWQLWYDSPAYFLEGPASLRQSSPGASAILLLQRIFRRLPLRHFN
jgi:hypothetical protein